MTGSKVGPYEIEGKIGEGGMGVVYKARDSRLGRSVALKFISDQLANTLARKRFTREAQAISALNHPNIVTIHDVGEEAGQMFIVMELLQGQRLRELIVPGGLPVPAAVQFTLQIAEALSAAHAAGIVHRDLKPGNVIVCAKGRVKVLDFGLAKFASAIDPDSDDTRTSLSTAGSFLGTASYASPEQCAGHEVDRRSDIFSLGIVFYELLCGERPFTGSSRMDLMMAICRDLPVSLDQRPGLAPWIEAGVLKMLQKRPEDRFQTMEEVIQALSVEEGASEHTITLSSAVVSAVTSKPLSVPPAAGSERTSIGVLPFIALSRDPDDEYLAAGIASEIISALSGLPGVRVPSQLSSFRFKGEDCDVRKAAETLQCKYLLTGTLRRAGSRIRVVAELDDPANEAQLWSKTYDRSIEDIFAVQEEIASAIAASTGGQLIRSRAESANLQASEDLDAWGLVRKAYYFVNHAYHAGAIYEAIDMLRRAIAIAPDNALAHAYLGFYLINLVFNNASKDPAKDFGEALELAGRAIQLAPGNAEVLENAGLVLFNCHKADQARGVLRRAVELAPFNFVAWGYLSLCIGWSGDDKAVAEAYKILDRLLQTAPDHPSVPYWLYFKAGVCARQGKFEEAAECACRSSEIQPRFALAYLQYANALGNMGRFEEAREAMDRMTAIIPGTTQEAYMRQVLLTTGAKERAEPHYGGLFLAGIYT